MKKIEVTDEFADWASSKVCKLHPEYDYIGELDEDNEIEISNNSPDKFSGHINIFEFLIANKVPVDEYWGMMKVYDTEELGGIESILW